MNTARTIIKIKNDNTNLWKAKQQRKEVEKRKQVAI